MLSALNTVQAFMSLTRLNLIVLSISTCLMNITLVPIVSAYAITKAAALKMIEYLGKENPYLRVINIQPGWVPTTMNGYQSEAPDIGKFRV